MTYTEVAEMDRLEGINCDTRLIALLETEVTNGKQTVKISRILIGFKCGSNYIRSLFKGKRSSAEGDCLPHSS